jgi:hypothetical protein
MHRPQKAVEELQHATPRVVMDIFQVVMMTQIGNGDSALFWLDGLMHGQHIGEFTPNLLAAVPKRKVKSRTVKEGSPKHG